MTCFRSTGSTLLDGSKHLKCNNIRSIGFFQVEASKICFNAFNQFLIEWLQLGTLNHSTLLNCCFFLVTFNF